MVRIEPGEIDLAVTEAADLSPLRHQASGPVPSVEPSVLDPWVNQLQAPPWSWVNEAMILADSYLPGRLRSSQGNWPAVQIVVDSRLPVTAKAFPQDGVIGINPRAFARGREEDRWGRWVAAVAHEWHHVVLWHAGPGSSVPAADSLSDPVVFWTNVLIEGVGTHLALQTGLFPDVQSQVEDRRLLERHFRAVRRHWPRLSASKRNSRDRLTVLFWRDKSAYWVGCWMVRSIEARFGRPRLLELLDRSGPDAAREFLKLYAQTEPRAALGLGRAGL